MIPPNIARVLLALCVAAHVALLPIMAAAHIASHDAVHAAGFEGGDPHQAEGAAEARESHLHKHRAFAFDLACEFCIFFNQLLGKKGALSGSWSPPPEGNSLAIAASSSAFRPEFRSAPPRNKSPPDSI